jgi:hypothetical protein
MRTAITGAALLAGIAGAAQSASAQHRDSLSIPFRKVVRIHTSGAQPNKLTGRYGGSASSGVIIISNQHASIGVPWDEIRRIDVQARRRPVESFGRGARVGAIISGSLAAVIIVAGVVYDLQPCADCMMPASVFTIPVGFVGTIGGTILGGLIAIPVDYRWQPVWPRER